MKAETKPLKRLPDSKSIYHCQRIFAQNKTIDNHQQYFLVFELNRQAFLLKADYKKPKQQMISIEAKLSFSSFKSMPTCGFLSQGKQNNKSSNKLIIGMNNGRIAQFLTNTSPMNPISSCTHFSRRPQIICCHLTPDGSCIIGWNLYSELIIIDSETMTIKQVYRLPNNITAIISSQVSQTHEIMAIAAFQNQMPPFLFPIGELLLQEPQQMGKKMGQHFRKIEKAYKQLECEYEQQQIVLIGQTRLTTNKILCGVYSNQTHKYYASIYKIEDNNNQPYICYCHYKFQFKTQSDLLHISLTDNMIGTFLNSQQIQIIDLQSRKKVGVYQARNYKHSWCFIYRSDQQLGLICFQGFHHLNREVTSEKGQLKQPQKQIQQIYLSSRSSRSKWRIFFPLI